MLIQAIGDAFCLLFACLMVLTFLTLTVRVSCGGIIKIKAKESTPSPHLDVYIQATQKREC